MMIHRPGQRVEPGLLWFKPGQRLFKPVQRCTNVKTGQPPMNQGSEAIMSPLDDNMSFRHNAGTILRTVCTGLGLYPPNS